jgi:lambda family phage minor tail protein L
MTIESDIQLLDPGSLVELFVLDLITIGIDEQYYFHNGVNYLGDDVVWDGQVYTRWPIEADGFERTGSGTQPTPHVRVGNVTGMLGAVSRANEDFVGVKLIRHRTFVKYLDAVNFSGGVNPTADPNVYFPDEIWFVDRKVSENPIVIEWELKAASDLQSKQLPGRTCIQNVCSWRYRSAECSYTGPAVADINDQPVTDLDSDVCGKRLSSCRLRFPLPEQLPTSAFPAVGLIR